MVSQPALGKEVSHGRKVSRGKPGDQLMESAVGGEKNENRRFKEEKQSQSKANYTNGKKEFSGIIKYTNTPIYHAGLALQGGIFLLKI